MGAGKKAVMPGKGSSVFLTSQRLLRWIIPAPCLSPFWVYKGSFGSQGQQAGQAGQWVQAIHLFVVYLTGRKTQGSGGLDQSHERTHTLVLGLPGCPSAAARSSGRGCVAL